MRSTLVFYSSGSNDGIDCFCDSDALILLHYVHARAYHFLYLMNSDSRIRIASEILKGIKVIKFFGQEDIHTVRLGYARKKELRYLQKLLMNEAFVYICGEVCLPMMMLFGFAALASYGLLTDAAGYSASLVFVLLAEGISFIPTALNSLIVSIISGKRINAFLSLPMWLTTSRLDQPLAALRAFWPSWHSHST